jgi:hypothetical protein
MRVRVRSSGRDAIQLTVDLEAACAIAASIRFASRFHETFKRLSERIAKPIELAAKTSGRGARGREAEKCRTLNCGVKLSATEIRLKGEELSALMIQFDALEENG